MSFAMDRYEPVAFHLHPDLMRAAEAQTAVLQPATPSRMASPTPVAPATPVSQPTPVPAVATRTPLAPAPPEPIAAYLIGMDVISLLRSSLADFLDAAGSRRDVRASVGVAAGGDVAWVLRDQVPFRVRAMPHYLDPTPMPDATATLTAVAAAVVADAVEAPARRQLVVLVWDRCPEPVILPSALTSALVLHCADAVLTLPTPNGATSASWVLARSRPGLRPSLLGHAGRLLERWEAFATVPPGLVLGSLPQRA